MIAAAHRASQILDDIRNLFGTAGLRQSPVDMNDLALKALHALDSELKSHNMTTRIELESQLPPIVGHNGQLQEVIVNLIQNAVDAMDSTDTDRRVLQVRTEHNGDAISVEIEDTGPGIDPKKSDNIFDAFFTTKPHGMGLGLAICRMIVERHEGQTCRLFRQSAWGHFSDYTASNKVASVIERNVRFGSKAGIVPIDVEIGGAALLALSR